MAKLSSKGNGPEDTPPATPSELKVPLTTEFTAGADGTVARLPSSKVDSEREVMPFTAEMMALSLDDLGLSSEVTFFLEASVNILTFFDLVNTRRDIYQAIGFSHFGPKGIAKIYRQLERVHPAYKCLFLELKDFQLSEESMTVLRGTERFAHSLDTSGGAGQSVARILVDTRFKLPIDNGFRLALALTDQRVMEDAKISGATQGRLRELFRDVQFKSITA